MILRNEVLLDVVLNVFLFQCEAVERRSQCLYLFETHNTLVLLVGVEYLQCM